MPKRLSAGILLYRRRKTLEIFLVHPGGPIWARKDDGAWSIPKGEYEQGEAPLSAAQREFLEETGSSISGSFMPLSPQTLASGKVISAWAVEGDIDAETIKSNTFEVEWPPRSGRRRAFPEVDRAAWFDLETAYVKIHPGQVGFLDELARL